VGNILNYRVLYKKITPNKKVIKITRSKWFGLFLCPSFRGVVL